MATKWTQPQNPPPPLFLGEKERNFVKHINAETMERIVGQQVSYYAIDKERSNYHNLYGECIKKTFLPPIRIYVLVTWEGEETEYLNDVGIIQKKKTIDVHFHQRRLQEDQELVIKVGDFVRFGDTYYEITKLMEPKLLFGQVEQKKVEISAKCNRARRGLFDAS